MSIFFYIVIFLSGLIMGSFLNCIIYRLAPHQGPGGGLIKGRSFCPRCKHQLKWLDLIPVLSFFILKGKCRYCQRKISWQYPIVEISTGILFLLFFEIEYLIIVPFLIVIFVYDLKHYIIPDKVVYPAIVIATIFGFANWLAALVSAGFFLAIVLISRGKWMGVGDIKLAFLMGVLLGWPNVVVAFFLAFMTGAIIGVGLIMAGKKSLQSEVPFGPFLVAGTLAALFYGQQIINWYLSFYG